MDVMEDVNEFLISPSIIAYYKSALPNINDIKPIILLSQTKNYRTQIKIYEF